jgi:aldehyde dehydrogenase (NAD+)
MPLFFLVYRTVQVTTPPFLLPGSSWTQPDPLGVVCIIAPWNFPIQLILNPLVAAIAAGNAAVIKPSEVSPTCAVLAQDLLHKYMDREAIRVVQGAVAETTALLQERFDHIFYTGGGAVATHILRAAAVHLTPVTLELGGKSPCIVARDADLDTTARRILAAKCMNAGQVCLAPDYILVEAPKADALTAALKRAAIDFYGDDTACQKSPDLGRIVNERHWDRIKGLLDSAGGTIIYGGQADRSDRFIAPTLIREPSLDSAVMREEIFGPLLPILAVPSVDDAIKFVTARPKPLALYVFTNSGKTSKRVLELTSSGGAVVNDAVIHNAVPDLPFGGVGPAGMGAYHGKFGFDTFSHTKAVLTQPTWIDLGKLRYPPFSTAQLKRLEMLIGALPALPSIGLKDVAIMGLSVAVALLSWKLAEKK